MPIFPIFSFKSPNVSAYILLVFLVACTPKPADPQDPMPQPATEKRLSLETSGDDFLEDLSHRSFRYFMEAADPTTGLVSDSAGADGRDPGKVSSIAATGFGLTALCIGVERGWISQSEGLSTVQRTLGFLSTMPGRHRGFFYHFVDRRTGERMWESELSSIDTALLAAGMITCREYFDDEMIRTHVDDLLRAVEWPWMLNGGKTLSMGWKPESGFIEYRWDHYSEHTLMQFLAMASETHPLSADLWHAWHREKVVNWRGRTFLQFPPLFIHQFSHAWIDFRDRRDAWADYWNNSVQATYAQHDFMKQRADEFPHYAKGVWGLTSSLSPDGYSAWGGPPAAPAYPVDGTVVPCAPAGSVPFAPELCLSTLAKIKSEYQDRVWTRYGFIDAFNPSTGWVADRVLGIDVGITLLMVENHRSGFVWEQFQQYEPVQMAMKAAGFVSTNPGLSTEDRAYLHQLAEDTWRSIDRMVHPETGLPYDSRERNEFTSVSNIGIYLTSLGVAREFGWLNDAEALARCRLTLQSIKQLKTWNGFRQSWNSVETLEGSPVDPWISVLDSGNLAAGLISAASAFQEERDELLALVEAMDWSAFYDGEKEALYGGWNTQTQQMNPDWHLTDLGSDSRMSVFLGIALGSIPLSVWEQLNREWETTYHLRYLKPGWQGGGLFMHYISGIWLDEKGTTPGQSAENFAMAQMEHARRKGYPVWGWSASQAPSGEYLGWGELMDEVVTPHASLLALGDFPRAVLDNSKALETLGVRSPDEGFYDSVNIQTGEVTADFLLLDQGMILLTLANELKDNAVRKWFEQNPSVYAAKHQIADYQNPAFSSKNALKYPVDAGPDLSKAQTKEISVGLNESLAEWQVVIQSSIQKFRFKLWRSDHHLAVRVNILDATPFGAESPDDILKQDCVEIFLDPDADGLRWGNTNDVQYGFSRSGLAREWFADRPAPSPEIVEQEDGYELRVNIPIPQSGESAALDEGLGFSIAVFDRMSETETTKTEWFWREEDGQSQLGWLQWEATVK